MSTVSFDGKPRSITIKCKNMIVNIPVKCFICYKPINCECNEPTDQTNSHHIIQGWEKCYNLEYNGNRGRIYPRAFPYDDWVTKKVIHICSRKCKNKLPMECEYKNLK